MADEEYVEVDAVVRMPKGERLADSRKTEGWSRGFTPKSSDKGPEHVEIRLKDAGNQWQPEPEPSVVYIYNDPLPPPPVKTREQEEFEELLRAAVALAILRAAEFAAPRIKRWWMGQALPFLAAKREGWQQRKARRKASKQDAGEGVSTVIHAAPIEEAGEGSDALATYEASMTSDEARKHLAELLVAQHFVNEKKRLLANARIADGAVPPELAGAVQALTPKQVENALESILASKPTLLVDLGQLLEADRNKGPLQLGSEKMKEALRLAGDDK